MTIREVKKSLKITDADIAKAFGYKNRNAYYESARRTQIENFIVAMYGKFSEIHMEKIKALLK